MKPKLFINQLEEKKIVEAIADAEKKTSGEICVYISQKKRADIFAAARNRFEKLGMTKTRLRNATLIYIAPATQQFAVLGDVGIHEKCGKAFWEKISVEMSATFRNGFFTDAIIQAVREVGAALSQHFPAKPDDGNELPNQIRRE